MNNVQRTRAALIRGTWRRLKLTRKFQPIFNKRITIDNKNMVCFKDSFKSSIWKLTLKNRKGSIPIVLKIFKTRKRKRPKSSVEINMYRKAKHIFSDVMPEIYYTEAGIHHDRFWAFMEYAQKLNEQIRFTPHYYYKIIPSLAKMHAITFNDRFYRRKQLFSGWLPRYQSARMRKYRQEVNKQTRSYLRAAMERSDLKKIITPYYSLLCKLLGRGPIYFPELIKAGQCIIHGDLGLQNIGCNNVNEEKWNIKFLDWEGAKFAPCWFDMVNLIGNFFAYRKDWKNHEEEIVRQCVLLYANEMKKHGVVFHTEPMKLYKMAYLQIILERNLYRQLSWEIDGRKKARLLSGFLEKLKVWGKELQLY